jgi:molybdopterin-containing oxidoreductase family membrane subunit
MALLLGLVGIGFLVYLKQLDFGLGITGMNRDVSWGFYIANFTFLVGWPPGASVVVLPYYLHDYKVYGRVTILGEFLAIASVVMCITFILVDLGQPMQVMNVLLYPAELGPVLGHDRAERLPVPEPDYRLERARGGRNGVHYQSWLKPLIYISIPGPSASTPSQPICTAACPAAAC